ncbi:MAG: hypothetical protein AVDCRST_MAG79-2130 [uncultured Thermoleophilia bacterium]|uniref:Glutamyl-tRNA reductase N-terminal domain-containing protein n=1 Tax=uncultured Thermoleophilia bacterium TaxID=1497501 RepID=A0A6J4UBW5_9ACTN|nr:MAG: hypothetical protein AVDCRST_MAG79-2130 [uncultured Thermoleophilia bacterium]
MTVDLVALVAEAPRVPAPEREALAATLRAAALAGTVVVETCHRVELYGARAALSDAVDELPAGVRRLEGDAVVDHVIGVAVGLRSVMLAEDQVLHQVRQGVTAARSAGPLPPELDRLFDTALRAGRRARTFLPGGRPVVGSRDPAHAAEVARDTGAATATFDPGLLVRDFDGIVVALAGPWTIGQATADAVATGGAWVADLSAPPAIPDQLAVRLGARLTTIDALATDTGPRPSGSLVG